MPGARVISLTRRPAETLRAAGGEALVHTIDDVLRTAPRLLGGLHAAYVLGSLASGDVRDGASDVDLLLVVEEPPGPRLLRAAGETLADLAEHCPLRGLEAVVYRREVLADPRPPIAYELNVNGGGAIPRRVSTAGDPPFWFLLDVAAARTHALRLAGPPPDRVIGPVPNSAVLEALHDSLAWHMADDGRSPDAVLNACRAWHWLEERAWLSKSAAGTWLRSRPEAAAFHPLLSQALAARRAGSDDDLEGAAVQRLTAAVLRRIQAVRAPREE